MIEFHCPHCRSRVTAEVPDIELICLSPIPNGVRFGINLAEAVVQHTCETVQ